MELHFPLRSPKCQQAACEIAASSPSSSSLSLFLPFSPLLDMRALHGPLDLVRLDTLLPQQNLLGPAERLRLSDPRDLGVKSWERCPPPGRLRATGRKLYDDGLVMSRSVSIYEASVSTPFPVEKPSCWSYVTV
ncbi:hypothetical protein GN956_G6753 [Arapaima gigas]